LRTDHSSKRGSLDIESSNQPQYTLSLEPAVYSKTVVYGSITPSCPFAPLPLRPSQPFSIPKSIWFPIRYLISLQSSSYSPLISAISHTYTHIPPKVTTGIIETIQYVYSFTVHLTSNSTTITLRNMGNSLILLNLIYPPL